MNKFCLFVGTESLGMTDVDPIAKSFMRRKAVFRRYPLMDLRWGTFTEDLNQCTHLFLALRSAGPEIEIRRNQNVEEIFNLIKHHHDDVHVRVSVLFLDEAAVERYKWIINEELAGIAFARSPAVKSKIPVKGRTVLVDDFRKPGTSDEIAKIVLEESNGLERAA